MFHNVNRVRHGVAAIALLLSVSAVAPAIADGLHPTREEILADIEATLGGVPTFFKKLPQAAASAWLEVRDLELSEETALDAKTKALISLAVASQIPCTYCIWADTNTARALGATDEEIGEAVVMAGLTRHWSTVFNGLQIDFEQFKQEMGGSQ